MARWPIRHQLAWREGQIPAKTLVSEFDGIARRIVGSDMDSFKRLLRGIDQSYAAIPP